jgi:S-adenosylmethionine-diacylglycerol 3-amino-3-carboxypropyl transferase
MRLDDWTTKKIFSYVHGNHLIYNSCWEDPRLDREAMALGPEDEVVLITSAGCNSLDYALDSPRRIYAVDMNFRQNALLELKIAGIRHLDFDQFFGVFGEGGHKDFGDWYRNRLRRDLSPNARAYWDRRQHYFNRAKPDASFYYYGASGVIARLVVKYLKLARIHSDALRLFDATSLAEQRDLYFSRIRDRFWHSAFKRALRADLTLSMLGIPQAQRDYLEKNCTRSIADFMEDCVEAVFTRIPTLDNYFWRVYLFGRYSRECCPEYLREESFNRLKGGLVDRIEIHTSHLTGFLASHHTPISRFVLLDHMDWLSGQHPGLLQQEWQALLDRAAASARFLWRSAGFQVDYVDPLRVNYRGSACRVGEILRYDVKKAEECHARDRVHTYGSFYIAHLGSQTAPSPA